MGKPPLGLVLKQVYPKIPCLDHYYFWFTLISYLKIYQQLLSSLEMIRLINTSASHLNSDLSKTSNWVWWLMQMIPCRQFLDLTSKSWSSLVLDKKYNLHSDHCISSAASYIKCFKRFFCTSLFAFCFSFLYTVSDNQSSKSILWKQRNQPFSKHLLQWFFHHLKPKYWLSLLHRYLPSQ